MYARGSKRKVASVNQIRFNTDLVVDQRPWVLAAGRRRLVVFRQVVVVGRVRVLQVVAVACQDAYQVAYQAAYQAACLAAYRAACSRVVRRTCLAAGRSRAVVPCRRACLGPL